MGRLIIATAAVVGAVVALSMAGFGTKTACTSAGNHPECDAIDRWARGGVIAVAIIVAFGGVVARNGRAMLVMLALAACAVVLASLAMFTVSPTT